MKKTLLFFTLLFNITMAMAQAPCATDKHHNDLMESNPAAKQAYLEAEYRLLHTDIQQFLQRNGANSTTIYEIPVVVHLMNDGTTPLKTDAEIIAWVNNCNKFYDTTFGGDWLTAANGGTVIPFKLVLAKRSPSCASTTGIVQFNVTATYPQYSTKGCNSSNTDGVSNVQLRALSRWDPQVYYNMYVVNTFDSTPISNIYGLQGYAGFPTNPDSGYDTFMKASVVTNTSDPTTLPHEFGHSMGLHHPFNTGSTTNCPTVSTGCAADNDLVCDTPSTKSLLGVNPLPANGSVNPCDAAGWNNVQYNVMNYTNSNRLFTAGQKDRAVASFLLSRLNLTKSLGGTALSGTPATVAATTCIPPAAPDVTGNFNFGPTKVVIGTIDNTSDGSMLSNSNQVLYDYTAKSCLTTAFKTNLAVSSNPQTLTLGCTTNTNSFSAWIDYDSNGIFETNELIVNNQILAPATNGVYNFNIPSSGVTLNTPLRLRVIGDRSSSDVSTTPCAQLARGQVEDYEVTITAVPLATENFDFTTLNVYPNPTANVLNIDLDKNIEEISVTNILGQTVLSKSINQSKTSIDLSNFAPATYFVKITTDGNSKVIKIVRQ
jgi:hypothetical protein